MKNTALELTVIEQEPRVDSRLMAQRLGIKHKNFVELIVKYESDISDFGILPFQTEISGVGQPQKYALLNEDQSVFVLTLSRNSDQVIRLKKELTKLFRKYQKAYLKEARKAARQASIDWQQARSEGKVERRELMDAFKRVKLLADEQNPENNADQYYRLATSAIYKLLFNLKKTPKGFRDGLPSSALRRLQMVECQCAQWADDAVSRGADYHEPFRVLRDRLQALVELIGSIDLTLPAPAEVA